MKRLSIQSFKNDDFFLLCVFREQIFNNEISQFIYKDSWRQNVHLRSEICTLLSFAHINNVKSCAYLFIRYKTFKGISLKYHMISVQKVFKIGKKIAVRNNDTEGLKGNERHAKLFSIYNYKSNTLTCWQKNTKFSIDGERKQWKENSLKSFKTARIQDGNTPND